METVKIIEIGDSLGIALTDNMRRKLLVSEGDFLHVLETPGGLKLLPYDAEFERQFKVAEKVMRKDFEVSRKLAD